MGCRIHLIRHGETIWNKDARFQGRADIPLSGQGIEQARALGCRLECYNFAAFFSSGLSRARQTAELIAASHGKPVEVVKGLEEISFGDWEGLTSKEIKERYSEESSAWWANPFETRIPGGETLAEMAARATASIKGIINKYPDEHVCVVAHGGVIRSIVGTALGLDLNYYWRLRQDNASLTIMEFYGWDKAILMLYNDISHLGTGLIPPV